MSELERRVEEIAAGFQASYDADIDLLTRRDKAHMKRIADLEDQLAFWKNMALGLKDEMLTRGERIEELEQQAIPDDVHEIIVSVLESERDRHIISGGLAANRKELEAALAWQMRRK